MSQVLGELKRLRKDLAGDLSKKAKRLDAILELLEPIHLHIKHIVTAYDDSGNQVIKVIYESGVKEIHISPNDEPRIDEFITSVNSLNMVSYADMEKVHNAIKIAESKKYY